MRGIAAIAVVVFHADVLFGRQLVQSGYLAVDFFFLLSGFVISHAYDRRLASGMSVASFAAARLVRFLPLYLVGALLGLLLEVLLVVTASSHAQEIRQVALFAILGLLFLPLLSPGTDLFPLNVPSWSLHHELVVNLLYAVFHRRLSKTILCLVALLACTGVVAGVASFGSAAFGPRADHYVLALARASFSFSVGVIIYRTQPWRPILRPEIAILTISAIFLAPVPPPVRAWFDLVAILFVFPLLLPSLSAFEPRNAFTIRASNFLGDTSYGVYALHYPLIWLTRGVIEKLSLDAAFAWGVALVVILPVASVVAERKFDLPLRRRIGRWIAGRAG